MPSDFPPPSAFRDVHFPGQHEGERIILVLRRHPVVFFITILYFLILTVVPLGVRLVVPSEFLPSPGGFVEGLLIILVTIYYLSLWLFFTFAWVDYYLDLWIVTDDRIINIEQAGLFNRVISEQSIVRVQDVTSEVRGLLPTFLNYGHVYVQTAGERARFIFEQVPQPDLVKKVVLQGHRDALDRAGISKEVEAAML